MKNCWRNWTLLLLIAVLALPAMARVRTDWTRYGQTEHSVQELTNTQFQAIIDSATWRVALSAGDTLRDTVWVQKGTYEDGYPSCMTVALYCSSGTVTCHFAEYYDAKHDSMTHENGDNVLFVAYGPGKKSVDAPFLGGRFLIFWWTAVTDAVFYPTYQKMRCN